MTNVTANKTNHSRTEACIIGTKRNENRINFSVGETSCTSSRRGDNGRGRVRHWVNTNTLCNNVVCPSSLRLSRPRETKIRRALRLATNAFMRRLGTKRLWTTNNKTNATTRGRRRRRRHLERCQPLIGINNNVTNNNSSEKRLRNNLPRNFTSVIMGERGVTNSSNGNRRRSTTMRPRLPTKRSNLSIARRSGGVRIGISTRR